LSNEPSALLAGERYRLIEVIGSGGMATVYRAWDETLQVHRAIKVMIPAMASREGLRQRFLSEARAMARLRHPNTVTVHDFGQEGDRCYIVMEWLEGGSLLDLLEVSGAMPPRRAAAYLLPVLQGLAVAHDLGIVHRDIKPDNVLLSSAGVPKITDFGIARMSDTGVSITQTGTTMGTWAFMAPEQRDSFRDADHRSDIYSVGATLYMLVACRLPADLHATNVRRKLLQGFPEPLALVIRRATEYEPEDRYQLALQMHEALAAVQDQLPSSVSEVFARGPRAGPVSSVITPAAGRPEVAVVEQVPALPTGTLGPIDEDQAAEPAVPWATVSELDHSDGSRSSRHIGARPLRWFVVAAVAGVVAVGALVLVATAVLRDQPEQPPPQGAPNARPPALDQAAVEEARDERTVEGAMAHDGSGGDAVVEGAAGAAQAPPSAPREQDVPGSTARSQRSRKQSPVQAQGGGDGLASAPVADVTATSAAAVPRTADPVSTPTEHTVAPAAVRANAVALQATASITGGGAVPRRLNLQNDDDFRWTRCRVLLDNRFYHRLGALQPGESEDVKLAHFEDLGGGGSIDGSIVRNLLVKCEQGETSVALD